MKKKKVVWTLSASRSLDEYFAFIEKDSPTAEIIRAARTLNIYHTSQNLINPEGG